MSDDTDAASNEPDLSGRERRAIAVLHGLSTAWPSTLKLVSIDGTLHVVRAHDPRYALSGSSTAFLGTFEGIPSDGSPAGVREVCAACGGLIEGMPVSVCEGCVS